MGSYAGRPLGWGRLGPPHATKVPGNGVKEQWDNGVPKVPEIAVLNEPP